MTFLLGSLLLSLGGSAFGQNKSSDPLDDRVQEVLSNYCLDCHADDEPAAGLDLSHFKTVGNLRTESDIWEKVHQRVASGSMPPIEYGEVPEDDRKWFAQWVDDALHKVDCSDQQYPGIITVRRLNRLEYRHSVRDLLGVDYEPAADFPGDDVGYGFDNIGEVLSLPPVLMEKYLDAAEKISQQVIQSPEDYLPPRNSVPLKDAQTEGGVNKGPVLSFYSNGTGRLTYKVPQPGLYQIRIQVEGQQAGDEPCKMSLALGGKPVDQYEIAKRDQRETIELQRRLNGELDVAIRFDNDFYDKEAPKGEQDRNLLVHSVELIGPMWPTIAYPEAHRQFFFVYPKRVKEEESAATRLLQVWSSRFFRRPAAKHEVQRLMEIYQAVRQDGASFEKGIQIALTAILVSPKFLYKVERPAPEDGSLRQLSDFELATSLSYFLWLTTPDESLLKAAAGGELTDPEGLRNQVRRMLASPRADQFMQNFASQWLQLRILQAFEPDPARFEGVDQTLLADMKQETELFCREILREDRSILELLDADFTFVNGRLARHYGLQQVDEEAEDFVRVSLKGTSRGGLLTQASILSVTSNPTRTSPVKRGKWIMENLLGEPPPPAAPDVVPLDKQELTGTLRQRMEQHRSDPACASCHRLMDPLGFALENFDAVGRWRQEDEGGAIDASGVLPSGEPFEGIEQLKEILTGPQKKKFVRCLAEKMLIYALGRGLRYEDQCAVNEIVQRLEANDYRMSELILAVVESAPFQQRQNPIEE